VYGVTKLFKGKPQYFGPLEPTSQPWEPTSGGTMLCDRPMQAY